MGCSCQPFLGGFPMMEFRSACALVCLVLLGCKTSGSKGQESSAKSVGSERQPMNESVVGHCQLFGRHLIFLNCFVRPQSGEALHAVLQASLFFRSSDIGQHFLNDRRLSGEDTYEFSFRFHHALPGTSFLSQGGLPEVITGELRRGPSNMGGQVIFKEVMMKTQRELFWEAQGTRDRTLVGIPYFAFLDDGELWATSVRSAATELKRPLRLRILDPLSRRELETLKRGALVVFRDIPDQGSREVFGFYEDMAATAGKTASAFPLAAEIF